MRQSQNNDNHEFTTPKPIVVGSAALLRFNRSRSWRGGIDHIIRTTACRGHSRRALASRTPTFFSDSETGNLLVPIRRAVANRPLRLQAPPTRMAGDRITRLGAARAT